MVQMHNGSSKLIGFKFIIPENYPYDPPHAFLDEPVNPTLIDLLDYLDSGNRIMFKYLQDWK